MWMPNMMKPYIDVFVLFSFALFVYLNVKYNVRKREENGQIKYRMKFIWNYSHTNYVKPFAALRVKR